MKKTIIAGLALGMLAACVDTGATGTTKSTGGANQIDVDAGTGPGVPDAGTPSTEGAARLLIESPSIFGDSPTENLVLNPNQDTQANASLLTRNPTGVLALSSAPTGQPVLALGTNGLAIYPLRSVASMEVGVWVGAVAPQRPSPSVSLLGFSQQYGSGGLSLSAGETRSAGGYNWVHYSAEAADLVGFSYLYIDSSAAISVTGPRAEAKKSFAAPIALRALTDGEQAALRQVKEDRRRRFGRPKMKHLKAPKLPASF